MLKASAIIEIAQIIIENESVQKLLFGVYSDNTPRSLTDAMNGEFLSPKDRKKMKDSTKKGRKKKKKKRLLIF